MTSTSTSRQSAKPNLRDIVPIGRDERIGTRTADLPNRLDDRDTAGNAMARRGRSARIQRRHLLAFFLTLLTCTPLCAIAGRPPLVVPRNPQVVLERLPHGYAALMPTTAATKPPSLPQIRILLSTAARTGDARLAARADALLARLPGSGSPELLKAKAFAAQHRHDFSTALRLLDAALDKDPDDGEARLSRSQIQLVQGRLDLARNDCGALTMSMQAEPASLCLIALTMRRGDEAKAAGLADRLIAQAGREPELMRYLLTLRGDIASRANDAHADQWFKRALAGAPDDVRTLAAYARHLRAHGDNRGVLDLLASAPDTDGLQLQRALAAHAVGTDEAPALIASQGRRYALAHAVGSQPELRDEAEYLLTLRGDAPAALRLALRNFEQQRDVEDVDILQRAAFAAGHPEALVGLQAWARSQQLALPPAQAAHE
jgi:hypothetical protein